jgi:hypothetical protein
VIHTNIGGRQFGVKHDPLTSMFLILWYGTVAGRGGDRCMAVRCLKFLNLSYNIGIT